MSDLITLGAVLGLLTIIALITDFVTRGYIPVTMEENIDGNYKITKLVVSKQRVFKKTKDTLYIPYSGNVIFMGRNIFKKEDVQHPNEEDSIHYDYNGYEEIRESEIKNAFNALTH